MAAIKRALPVALAVLMLTSVVPTFVLDAPVVGTAQAQGDIVEIGYMNFEVQNWNPLCIEMVEDYVVCYLMYSSLFTYDEDWQGPVNDLAVGELGTDHAPYYFVVHPDGSMTTYINITQNAYFRNAANPDDKSRQLTAADVVYTFNTAKENVGKTFDWYLEECFNFTAVSPFQVSIDTKYQKSTLIEDLSGIPILNAEYWGALPNPVASLQPDAQLGTSAFIYADSEKDAWYEFAAAPNYHGATDYGRTVDIDGIRYDVYTETSSLVMDIEGGTLDAVNLYGDLPSYGEIDETETVHKYAVQEPGICDIAINAIPLSFRTSNYATGNKHLLDPFVRQAIMMTLNKTFINEKILMGLSTPAVSVVQPGFWHLDIDETPTLFDPAGARLLLEAHGYEDTDDNGLLEATNDAYVVREGILDPKKDNYELTGIRCQAPDTDSNYWKIAQPWAGWAAQAGIGFTSSLESESIMTNQAWYQADYDIWVWHWGWGPEPVGGALSCWLTSEIEVGGDNCQEPMGPWWYDTTNYTEAPTEWGLTGPYSSFDQNVSVYMNELDRDQRKIIADSLQQMVYDSFCENPPYYDLGVYAVNELRFTGWGNWTLHNGRPITSDLLWVWFDLLPTSNQPARFDIGLQSRYTAIVNVSMPVSIEVSDPNGDPIQVNWSFGDGAVAQNNITGDTTVSTLITQSHTYTALATGLNLTVSLWDYIPNHEISMTATVNVLSEPDEGPTITSLVPDYGPPGYVDMPIGWTVVASDPETGSPEALTITWDWGDGTSTTIQSVPATEGASVTETETHTWIYADVFDVTVYVFDGFLNDPTDPAHNVSFAYVGGYEVIENTAPTAPEVSDFMWNPGVEATITATASDADPDVLRFTWEWDDGTFTVEDIDTSGDVGAPVASTVTHTWDTAGIYDFTVWVDDLTGEAGHNVSTTATATIAEGEVPPSSLTLTQSPHPGMVNATVTLTVGAVDGNGDALTVTIDFGDASPMEVNTTLGGTTGVQTCAFEHIYTAADTYNVTIWVDDGNDNNETDYFDVEVIANAPPEIGLQSSYTAKFNQAFNITPVLVADDDDDPLTVWYDWGDDSELTKAGAGYSAEHVYMEVDTFTLTAYVDDGTGIAGHNVSMEADVIVSDPNFLPSITMTIEPDVDAFEIDQVVYFNVTAYDYEGDLVTVNISFGDGTYDEDTHDLDPKTNYTFEFEHAYAEAGTYQVRIVVMDNVTHADDWTELPATVTVEEPPSEGFPWVLVAGVALIAILALVAVMFLLKKKKGKSEAGGSGGMEGMAPPEEAPPQT